MTTSDLFKESIAEVPDSIKAELDLSFAIADKIDSILKERNLSQKEFAKMMGKSEPEVCRWLNGRHNFTIKTIAKISTVLKEPIIYVCPE